MILLDTDHLTVVSFPEHSSYALLTGRMQSSTAETFGATVVSLEEQVRGWLAEISRWRDVRKQVRAYDRLASLFEFFKDWDVIRFDERRLRKQGVRIGSQDLKIASIALVNDAMLLSANLRDFHAVPGLRVESWLE